MYHLHAILCHKGTLNRGHYYSFIRVGGQKQRNGDEEEEEKGEDEGADDAVKDDFDDRTWVKFNDTAVVPTFKHIAIGTGQGGYNTSYKCEVDEESEEDLMTEITAIMQEDDNEDLGLQDRLSADIGE